MDLFKTMLSLRDEFVQCYSRDVAALDSIKTGIVPSDFTTGVTSPEGVEILISGHQNQDNIQIIGNGSTVSIDLSNFTDQWNNTPLSNIDMTVGEITTALSQNTNSYEILSQLATKYSYANRVKYNDLLLYTDGLSGDDVRTIRDSLFNASDDDGYISIHSFMSILQTWHKDVDDAADRESFKIDSTNPFSLQCLMNTVISGVINLVSLVVTAIKGIWAVIGGFIVGIVSLITHMINYVGSLSDVVIDYNCNNQFIAGPVIASNGLDFYEYLPEDRSIYHSNNGGLATFMWLNDDYSKVKMNSYLTPLFKPYQLINWLVTTNRITYRKENNISWFILNNYQTMYVDFTDIYHSVPDWCKYSVDDPAITPGEIMGSIAANLFLYSIYLAANNRFSANRPCQIGIKYVTSANPGTPAVTSAADEKVFFYAARHLLMAMDEPSYDSFHQHEDMDMEQFADSLTSWLSNDILPKRDSLLQRATSGTSLAVEFTYAGLATDDFVDWTWPLPYTLAAMNMDTVLVGPQSIDVSINLNRYIKCDCLPINCGVTLPHFNSDTLKTIFAVIALATTITAMVVTPLSISMAKRKSGKQALRADNLNKLRTDFLNDPKDPIKKDAYESAALKFDTFGKIFGWGSFDAANGWFNAPSTSETTHNSMLSSILSRASDEQTTESLLLQIRNLIKLIP